MVYENGVNWEPQSPSKRGRHATFAGALDTVAKTFFAERGGFAERIATDWNRLFPGLAARPDRIEDGRLFLRVRSAPALFAMRPKLPGIRRTLAQLPDFPPKLRLTLEIRP